MIWILDNSNKNNFEKIFYIVVLCIDKNVNGKIISNFENFSNHFRNINLGVSNDYNEVSNYINKTNCILIDLNNEFSRLSFFRDNFKSSKNCIICSNSVPVQIQNDTEDFSFFGYQRSNLPYDTYLCLNTGQVPSFSLGDLTKDIYDSEPYLRNIETLIIDLNCLKLSETLDVGQNLPTGLTVEQVCQLLRFSSTSKVLKSIYFNLKNFNSDVKYSILNILLWYFCEGVDEVCSINTQTPSFSEYIVDLKTENQSLIFRLNNNTDQWDVKSGDAQEFIPCNRKVYEQTLEGIIPDFIKQNFLNF